MILGGTLHIIFSEDLAFYRNGNILRFFHYKQNKVNNFEILIIYTNMSGLLRCITFIHRALPKIFPQCDDELFCNHLLPQLPQT